MFSRKMCCSSYLYLRISYTDQIVRRMTTPLCVAWCYLWFDTQFHWILLRAGINRNCNIFIVEYAHLCRFFISYIPRNSYRKREKSQVDQCSTGRFKENFLYSSLATHLSASLPIYLQQISKLTAQCEINTFSVTFFLSLLYKWFPVWLEQEQRNTPPHKIHPIR